MVKKIMRVLSGCAVAVLLSAAYLTTDVEDVLATGTNTIAVMSKGANAVQETVRATEIAGGFAFLILIGAGLYLVQQHGGIGLAGLLIFAIGAGLVIQSREAIEGAGYTAAVL